MLRGAGDATSLRLEADWDAFTLCDTYTVDLFSRIDWGDGLTSLQSTPCDCWPTHRYEIGGSYRARMQVLGHLGTDSWIGGPPCPDTGHRK